MPAPSFQALYDFPGAVAYAWGSILAADSSTLIGTDTLANANAFFYGPRDNSGEKSKDRIDYLATSFTQASARLVKSTLNANYWPAHYTGEFTTTISTPIANTSAAAMHGARVGRVLLLASAAAARFTSSNLPYYDVASIELTHQPNAEADEDEQTMRTEIKHSIELWVRPDAFPATIP